jgi:hypothetical protein
MIACAYRALTADQLVNEGPTLVTGWVLNNSLDSGLVNVYDGMDTLSGTLVWQIQALASYNKSREITFPVLFGTGLYVDIGAGVTRFTVEYIPLRSASPLTAYENFILKSLD